uniref:Uncharacterized protein n=1 Tax=viral metagenome TaxID=1070528 RepID=A0A6M3L595_9ZZZZ
MFAFGAAAWSATYDLEVAEGDPDQITSALWMGPQDCKSKLVETNGHLRWTINPAPRFVRFKLWIVNMNAVAPDFDPLVISGSCLPLSVRT